MNQFTGHTSHYTLSQALCRAKRVSSGEPVPYPERGARLTTPDYIDLQERAILQTMATALARHLVISHSIVAQRSIQAEPLGSNSRPGFRFQVPRASVASDAGGSSVNTLDVPRLCTLQEFKEFSEGGEPSMSVARPRGESTSEGVKFYDLLVANARATVQVENFETLSGRLAMMAFALALGNEFVTGNSVFSGIDVESLFKVMGCCALIALSAAGLAFAKRGKVQVASLLTNSCKNVLDFAVDSVIEGLFFEDSDSIAPWSDDRSS